MNIVTKFSLGDTAYVVDSTTATATSVRINSISAKISLPASTIAVAYGLNTGGTSLTANVVSEADLYTAEEARVALTNILLQKTAKITDIV